MPIIRTAPMVLPGAADALIFEPALNWWRRTYLRRGRLPSRTDLSPDQITPAALPHAMLIDIEEGGSKLYWRLAGTAHVNRNKRDLKGADFDDVYVPNSVILRYVKDLYKDLVESRCPIWVANEITYRLRGVETEFPLRIRRLMLPLIKKGEDVDLCLTILSTDYNPNLGISCGEQWRNANSPGEVERVYLSEQFVEAAT